MEPPVRVRALADQQWWWRLLHDCRRRQSTSIACTSTATALTAYVHKYQVGDGTEIINWRLAADHYAEGFRRERFVGAFDRDIRPARRTCT